MTKDKTVTMSRELAESALTIVARNCKSNWSARVKDGIESALAAPIVEADGMGEAVDVVYQYRAHWNDIWLDTSKAEFEEKSLDKYSHTYITRKLFTSQPAPVSAVIDEQAEFAEWMHAVIATTQHQGAIHKVQRRDLMSRAEEKSAFEAWQARACLDKVKELNQ